MCKNSLCAAVVCSNFHRYKMWEAARYDLSPCPFCFFFGPSSGCLGLLRPAFDLLSPRVSVPLLLPPMAPRGAPDLLKYLCVSQTSSRVFRYCFPSRLFFFQFFMVYLYVVFLFIFLIILVRCFGPCAGPSFVCFLSRTHNCPWVPKVQILFRLPTSYTLICVPRESIFDITHL